MIAPRFLSLLAIVLSNAAFAIQEKQVIDLNVEVKKDVIDQRLINEPIGKPEKIYSTDKNSVYESIHDENRSKINELARPNLIMYF
jgi:hypothetical protein